MSWFIGFSFNFAINWLIRLSGFIKSNPPPSYEQIKNNYKIFITINIKKRNAIKENKITTKYASYRCFWNLVSNLQMLNDETTELQNKFIQWTTRLPEQIKMQYAADL